MANQKPTPARPSPVPLAQWLEQAVQAHQQGRLEEAVPLYRQILAHHPRHTGALTNLASIYTRQERYPEALAHYREAIKGGDVAPELWFNYGNLQQKLAMTAEAITSFQTALRLQPNLYPAHYNVGNLLRDQGRLAEALVHYQAAIRLNPRFWLACRNLGNLFRQMGRYAEAIQQHRLVLTLAGQTDRQRGESHYNLANALADDGQTGEAIDHYQAAVRLVPDGVDGWIHLGHLKQQTGDWMAAEQCYRAVLERQPDAASGPLHLIRLYQAHNQTEAAQTLLTEALARFPDDGPLLRLHGDRLYQQDEAEAALAVYQRIEALQPGLASTANALGVAYRAIGQTDEAEAAWRRCLTIDPRHVVALTNLGTLCRLKKRHEEALTCLRLAVQIQPDDPDSVASLACTLIDLGFISEALHWIDPLLTTHAQHLDLLGMKAFALVQQARIEEGQTLLARACQIKPDSLVAIGNTLFSSLYRDTLEAADQTRLHRELAEQVIRHAKPLPPRSATGHSACLEPHRRRIGYLSPDFRTHPVGLFMEPVLQHHDADRFHITCYALPSASDETTRRLMGHAHRWRDLEGWKLERMAAQIQEDDIEILIDLAGYTAGGRMDLMACRPAPIQAIFLGYPYTSGLATMDYLIADAHLIPPHQASLYTERVVRLPQSVLCYQNQTAPAVAPLPALTNGFITFGSFNNLPKLSASCLDLWARVLKAVPQSRLALKASSLGDEGTCALFRQHFVQRGVEADRIWLRPVLPSGQHMDAFGLLDIALDPIPFNGATTSCDTLWMGVPLVTLAGEGYMSRMGVSLLTTLGHPEWIATSPDEYVEMAATLAADIPALARLRARLRPQMEASGLCDAVGYTAHLEELYLGMIGNLF